MDSRARLDDATRCYRVLVVDLVGLLPDADGKPDVQPFKEFVQSRGATFWQPGSLSERPPQVPGIVFEYRPNLHLADELIALCGSGDVDAVIAAATFIPDACLFSEGGVRIGAGTANMASRSWVTGEAPLMNTPGLNSRATAHMVLKALLRVRPDLPFDELHKRIASNQFDTAKDLVAFPTQKLEGQTIAVLGYGNIGREVALLAQGFGMRVSVYARPAMQPWIESEGFSYCSTPLEAAQDAQVLSVHLGLGVAGPKGHANAGIVHSQLLNVLARGATLINFDRGELVDAQALGAALRAGQLSHVAIDADIFRNAGSGELSGPMVPYLALLEEFGANTKRLLLLPHAAADTDHPSRVAGALAAADQILAAIRYRCVANCVGQVPIGYTNLGREGVLGVGKLSRQTVKRLVADAQGIESLRNQLAQVDAWLLGLQKSAATGAEPELPDTNINGLVSQLRRLGLLGPGQGS